MRKVRLCFLYLLCIALYCSALQVVENYEKPISKNAGRVVKLKKLIHIEDIGDKFFFQSPRNPKIAPDNSIIVLDSEQFLQYDKNGNFIRNLFKKGQGPGEMGFIWNYSFFQDSIISQNLSPTKIIWFNLQGELIKDITIHKKTGRLRYLFYNNDTYYFIKSGIPRISGEAKIVDVSQELIAVNNEGNEATKLESFPTKSYVSVGKQGSHVSIPINNFIYIFNKDKYLFVSHTQEYQLKIYDTEARRLTRIFKRQYQRVKTSKKNERLIRGPIQDGKVIAPPSQKYVNDIENLFIVSDKLWVQTSTIDKEKGTLFDVFDFDGKYLDCFFIKLPKQLAPESYGFKPLYMSNGFLLTIEIKPDETFSIVKYRIIDADITQND